MKILCLQVLDIHTKNQLKFRTAWVKPGDHAAGAGLVKDWIKIVNAAYTPELDLEETPEKKPDDDSKPK